MKPITETESKSRNFVVLHANYNWCIDIMKRVDMILKAEYYTPQEKIDGITWLIKQGLKAESEE
jgi:hypothetical protein